MDYCNRLSFLLLLPIAVLSSCREGIDSPMIDPASRTEAPAQDAATRDEPIAKPGSEAQAKPPSSAMTHAKRTVSQNPDAESAISKLIPPDTVIKMSAQGDLNGDGGEDVIAVLEKKAQSETDPRKLAIFLGTASGFKASVENPNAILCRSCGGAMGDPLAQIAIERGGFLLRLEGGSRELWSRVHHFAYSAADQNWYLVDTESKVLDRLDDNEGQRRIVKAEPRSVSIGDFDAELIAEELEN